ncbi:hypothetical protein HN51_025845 [Arachis hypogaea]
MFWLINLSYGVKNANGQHPTTSSVNITTAEKQRLTKSSLSFNYKNKCYKKVSSFDTLVPLESVEVQSSCSVGW